MGGCTNCRSKSGCDDRKGSMFAAIDDVLAHLYPTRTWGELDPDAALDGGVDDGDVSGLADELAQELDAATFVRPGGDDELCDYVYVLCLGRPPCLIQVRDGGVPVPDEWDAAPDLRELYLRICLSRVARVAAVQQVAVDLVQTTDAGLLVREAPRAGVYDAPLLRRFQRLVALLPAYNLLHLDFGEITTAPRGFAPGAWAELYGTGGAAEPAIANYLFFPQPATTAVTSWIDRAAAAAPRARVATGRH